MLYFKLQNKINEVKAFSQVGNTDLMSTGIPILDGFIGLKKGYPIFVGGAPHSGKTEFVLEILINTSMIHKWKHFIYCGEGGNIEHIYNELLHKYLGKQYKYADEKDKLNAEYFIDQHFVIANHDIDFTIESFYEAVALCENELNIKFDTTCFDPFNDIKDETIERFGGREDKYLAHALKQVRISSKQNNRIDILVNHIADIRPVVDKDGNRHMPPAMPNEWAGGRTWWRRAFLMLLVYRPPIHLKDSQGVPFADNETHIYVQKVKPKGVAKMGMKSIFWDWQKNRYYCYMEAEKVYSCQQPNVKPLKPSTDFTNTIKDEGTVF